ncbi:MAG: SulP family inorganic anion transporter, partial [Actinomycetota bacterium]
MAGRSPTSRPGPTTRGTRSSPRARKTARSSSSSARAPELSGARIGRPRPGDLVAGFSVAMLIVPQAIGLATLAGLPPEQGIYAAALAPLITAFT